MKKYLKDFHVREKLSLGEHVFLLKVSPSDASSLGDIKPGQFVEIRVDNTNDVFLRRPISVHFVDEENNMLWLLIQIAGKGTKVLSALKEGDTLNLVYPLGNGFSILPEPQKHYLLIGGGIGVAPLLELGKELKRLGNEVSFLLGAKTAATFVELDMYAKFGTVYLTTEDGSTVPGFDCCKGFVTNHPAIGKEYDAVRICGPTPMMKAVTVIFKQSKKSEESHYCEVSLENKMACGLGVCLCCVQETKEGHKCVCSDGPVFDINDLNW